MSSQDYMLGDKVWGKSYSKMNLVLQCIVSDLNAIPGVPPGSKYNKLMHSQRHLLLKS